MSAQQSTGLSKTARSDRRKAIATLGAVAGLIGPLIFTVGFVIQGLLRPGEYDPITEPVSALEAGPNGSLSTWSAWRYCPGGFAPTLPGAALLDTQRSLLPC
jgi:hypothetical protein